MGNQCCTDNLNDKEPASFKMQEKVAENDRTKSRESTVNTSNLHDCGPDQKIAARVSSMNEKTKLVARTLDKLSINPSSFKCNPDILSLD